MCAMAEEDNRHIWNEEFGDVLRREMAKHTQKSVTPARRRLQKELQCGMLSKQLQEKKKN